MLANYERRMFAPGAHVWIARYQNLHNLPHWHFEHELILVQEGSAHVRIDDRVYPMQKNMCIFCHGNSIHYINGSADSILLVTQFDQKLSAFVPEQQRLAHPCFFDRYHILERLSEIAEELDRKELYHLERVDLLLSLLLTEIFRGEVLQKTAHRDTTPLSQYRELLKAIDQSDELPTFKDAADFMHMSDSYFSRYFQHLTGMSYSQYLNALRIEKAIRLLQQTPRMPMTQIMMQSGFNTVRNFNRVFKKFTGFAPRHLPSDFSFNIRSIPSDTYAFDPTLDNSILL